MKTALALLVLFSAQFAFAADCSALYAKWNGSVAALPNFDHGSHRFLVQILSDDEAAKTRAQVWAVSNGLDEQELSRRMSDAFNLQVRRAFASLNIPGSQIVDQQLSGPQVLVEVANLEALCRLLGDSSVYGIWAERKVLPLAK